ncbi:MAG: hypothetical protein MI863_01385 [Desulfobacterales bacterium]|nr:hypothetical protein [Desulfobacterales bacterium]
MQCIDLDKPSSYRPSLVSRFIETNYIKSMTTRALGYIKAGLPLNLRGISGTGKTTLAIYIASKLRRPLVLIHGYEAFYITDITDMPANAGQKAGAGFTPPSFGPGSLSYKRRLENGLAAACKYGYTLVYDEFSRSALDKETAHILLHILQEKCPGFPAFPFYNPGKNKIHKNFTAIFTSSPEIQMDIYKGHDALTERMLTLDLDNFDRETEICIVKSASGLNHDDSEKIVTLVRELRASKVAECLPTIRAGMMIAKTVKKLNRQVSRNDLHFIQICLDIVSSETRCLGNRPNMTIVRQTLIGLVEKHCR